MSSPAPPARPIVDTDLLGRIDNQVDTIAAVALDVCRQKVEPDRINFDPESVQGARIAETAEYEGVRIRLRRGSLLYYRIGDDFSDRLSQERTRDAADGASGGVRRGGGKGWVMLAIGRRGDARGEAALEGKRAMVPPGFMSTGRDGSARSAIARARAVF